MSLQKPKFTRIKGAFSEVRRLPRLGKIRLGLKKQSVRTGKEYPVETEYFVCPPEVQAVYGETPTELDIMFPIDDPEQVFIQKLAFYGSGSGLKCHGNGEVAEEYDEKAKAWLPRKCPCDRLEKGECGEQSHLMVLLPKVSMGGCYQITTGSYHSTVSVNSSLDYIRGLAGRIALLPMKLKRVPQEMTHEGKKRTHYTLSLVLDATLPEIVELRANPASLLIPAQYQIEGPVEVNPVLDAVDEVVNDDGTVDAEDLAGMSDAEMDAVQEKMKKAKERGDGAANGSVGLPPQQAPHSTQQGSNAPAPPPKAPLNIPNTGKPDARADQKPIDPSQWQDMINAIDENPNLREIKEVVKKGMKIKTLHLIAPGQHEFLRRFCMEAEKQGYQEDVQRILG